LLKKFKEWVEEKVKRRRKMKEENIIRIKQLDQHIMSIPIIKKYLTFFQAEDGIRDIGVTGVQTCCSSDLLYR
jgi:hypothetical protein